LLHFEHKKTQSRADKDHSLAAIADFRFRCQDKIEPNLQSQNVRRTLPKLMESRFQRDQQFNANRRLVNAIRQISAIFFPGTIHLHPALYLFASGWVLKLQGAECKIRGELKRKVPARNFSLFYGPSDDDFVSRCNTGIFPSVAYGYQNGLGRCANFVFQSCCFLVSASFRNDDVFPGTSLDRARRLPTVSEILEGC